jgi:ribose-phosphate pyrophosphokinase
MNVVGDVSGQTCIIQDDIIDTAGTIVKAAHALKANGAERVLACAVHGVLSGPAIGRLEAAPIDQVIIQHDPLNNEAWKARRSSSCHRAAPGQAIRAFTRDVGLCCSCSRSEAGSRS